MPVEKVCEQCGQNFSVKPSHQQQRFCSHGCKTTHETLHGRPAAQVAVCTFACRACGNPFTMKPSYVRAYQKKWGKAPMYCSTRCGGIGRQLPEKAWQVHCTQCGKPMPIQRKLGGTVNRQKRLCSTECRSLFRRLSYQANNPEQKMTRRIARNGYVRMIVPGKNGKPSRDVFEHRYNMEQHLTRELRPEETVHHINGIRSDNRIENLALFNSRHGPGQRVVDKVQFAIEILIMYPEFCAATGYELRRLHT